MYSKRYLGCMLLAAGLLAGACNRLVPEAGEIRFRVQESWQAGTKVTMYGEGGVTSGSFGVSAYNSGTTTVYIDGSTVSYVGGAWAFDDGKHYWPASGTLDFQAWMPASRPAYITLPTYTVADGPGFTCSDLPLTTAGQASLGEYVYAVELDHGKAQGDVALSFSRPFAVACFQLDGSPGVTLHSITIEDVYNNGVFTHAGGWTSTGSAGDLVFDLADTHFDEAEGRIILGTPLLVKPQTIGTQSVVVDYTLDGASRNQKTCTATIASWAAGYSYTYTLTLHNLVSVDATGDTIEWSSRLLAEGPVIYWGGMLGAEGSDVLWGGSQVFSGGDMVNWGGSQSSDGDDVHWGGNQSSDGDDVNWGGSQSSNGDDVNWGGSQGADGDDVNWGGGQGAGGEDIGWEPDGPTVPEGFGGPYTYNDTEYYMSQGNLYKTADGYALYPDWTGGLSQYGVGDPSANQTLTGNMYFNWIHLAGLFDTSIDTSASEDIDNSATPIDGCMLPSAAQWRAFTTGTDRSGASVNGTDNCRYALIQLTDITYNNISNPVGLLLLPDNKTLTGMSKTFTWNTASTTGNTGVTLAELQEYIAEDCVFLPAAGCYGATFGDLIWSSGGSYGLYWSSSNYNGPNALRLVFGGSNVDLYYAFTKSQYYLPVRLICQ